MNIMSVENFFGNSSFFFLFLSMIAYWVQIAFRVQKWNIGRISMMSANICLLVLLLLRWKESGHFPLSNLYESLMFLAWSLSTFHLILETIESRSNPKFSTSSDFFPSNRPLPGFVRQSVQSDFPSDDAEARHQNVRGLETKLFFVGAFTSPTALFINAFATFQLPLEMQQSSPLVPALQSNWLMMHVTVMILSYSALICGSLLSIAFLILTKNISFDSNVETNAEQEKSNITSVFETSSFVSVKNSSRKPLQIRSSTQKKKEFFPAEMQIISQPVSILEFQEILDSNSPAFENNPLNFTERFSKTNDQNSALQTKKKFAENLDNLSYRILGIGFPFLTIGILSGAVWANEAWGSYWSWDPKETWAFATWLVFAIYLHLRISKGWRGKKPAILASVGFVIVWICFLGVNLLGEGLHSYGFFRENTFS